jgi:hypothetical protein
LLQALLEPLFVLLAEIVVEQNAGAVLAHGLFARYFDWDLNCIELLIVWLLIGIFGRV